MTNRPHAEASWGDNIFRDEEKVERKADYVKDGLPAAASQPASPPLARRSAPEICLFLPSFWRRAVLLSPLRETGCWLRGVSTRSRRGADLRFVAVSVAVRWRASSQLAVCRRWCDQLGDGDSTTHFRVGCPKLWLGDPSRASWRVHSGQFS